MKLYLSSYRLGDEPQKLVPLLSSNKKAAVIMNATDDDPDEIRKEKLEREFADLRPLGIEPEEIDLREYFGKKEELFEKLSEFGMVWIRGGNTFMLMRAFVYSGFDEFIKSKVSDKDFVYAGYSAGVCILAPSLKGLDIVDDPHLVPKGYKEEVTWEGLGLLPYALAPHYKSDHPESAGVDQEIAYMEAHNIPHKTLRDGEVIVEEISG